MLAEVERFNKWLRRKAPQTSTARHYTNDLELFFAWAHKPPAEITVTDIDAFIERCQAQGRAIATVNRRLAALRSFYAFLAVESDAAPRNPVLPRRHFIRQGRRLPRDVEDAALQRLFAVIVSPRDRAIFLLMLRCGLRVSEVRLLSLQDLYLHPRPTHLPRIWLHGKGGAQRVVYLSPQLLAALQAWLQVRPNAADPAVFLNRFGHRLTVTGIQLQLAHYCHRAGVWITCHQFRHTFARHMIEAQMPVTTLQKLLGHAHLPTTQTYLHISDRQVQADYQAAIAQVSQQLLPGGER